MRLRCQANLFIKPPRHQDTKKRGFERGEALISIKIGSPFANQALKDIARTREKLPEDQFQEILKKFNLEPGEFTGD